MSDFIPLFGSSKSDLSCIFNLVSRITEAAMGLQVLDDVYSRFSHLLTDLDLVWLDKQQFAFPIEGRGAPLTTCIGFIDGATRAIATSSVNQRPMFNGHKRIHCYRTNKDSIITIFLLNM